MNYIAIFFYSKYTARNTVEKNKGTIMSKLNNIFFFKFQVRVILFSLVTYLLFIMSLPSYSTKNPLKI